MGISIKSTSGKILASVALIGTAAAVAGLGTYGAFTDSTTTADQKVTAGTVNIDLSAPGSLVVPIDGLLPGDSVEKFATLKNSGGSDFNTVTLTTKLATGATANALTQDRTNGLKITIETCSTSWTVVPQGVDTCAGSASVLPASPILGTNVLSGPASLAAGKADYLKITTSLPADAGNEFQGLSSTIGFTFDATQRTGTLE